MDPATSEATACWWNEVNSNQLDCTDFDKMAVVAARVGINTVWKSPPSTKLQFDGRYFQWKRALIGGKLPVIQIVCFRSPLFARKSQFNGTPFHNFGCRQREATSPEPKPLNLRACVCTLVWRIFSINQWNFYSINTPRKSQAQCPTSRISIYQQNRWSSSLTSMSHQVCWCLWGIGQGKRVSWDISWK